MRSVVEIGRDPATIQRSVLALSPNPDPFSSLDAFDEYVGGYEAIGIGELIFYWPPVEYSYGDVPGPGRAPGALRADRRGGSLSKTTSDCPAESP